MLGIPISLDTLGSHYFCTVLHTTLLICPLTGTKLYCLVTEACVWTTCSGSFNTKDKLFLVTRVYFRICSTHFHAIGWKMITWFIRYMKVERSEIERATFWSQVQCHNHYTTMPSLHSRVTFKISKNVNTTRQSFIQTLLTELIVPSEPLCSSPHPENPPMLSFWHIYLLVVYKILDLPNLVLSIFTSD